MEFKKYEKTITVNGHKVKCEVVVEITEDDPEFLLDQDFETDVQRAEYTEKINRGAIFAGCIHVTARAEGLEGTDSLGACELKPNNMFNSSPFEKSVNSYLTDYGMEKNALAELKKALTDEYLTLVDRALKYKKYTGKAGAK